jgi:uncharacterized protein (UPF0332 family)
VATWNELADDNEAAARLLLENEYFRPSVSRAYYAVYCALTAELVALKVRFGRGWNNPPHEQLLRVVERHLKLPTWKVRLLKTALRRLRIAREDAEYRPRATVDSTKARDCLRDAGLIRDMLENRDER